MSSPSLIVDADALAGTGGFLAIRRLSLRLRRGDGSTSRPFPCDVAVRPYGQDAVVVVAYARRADGGVDVLLRDCLRPGLALVRDAAAAPLPEPPSTGRLLELPAGIVEQGDHGEAGLRARGAAELHEEAGFVVAPGALRLLGAGTFPSPGSMPEKFYFVAVAVDPAAQQAAPGDGSPMEEGATTCWRDLDAAIAACVAGELTDAKTELGLRRLRDALA